MAFEYEPDRLVGMVPNHLHAGLKSYIEQGISPGGGLTAILCDAPCSQVIFRVDRDVAAALEGIYKWLTNYAPAPCWGSREKFDAWREAGGIKGREEG